MATAREMWKLVDGFPYEVSDQGQVRRIGGKTLRPRVAAHGYLRVSLGAGNDRLIHRLVAAAFHGPPPNGWHADHINSDRADNRADNLRWLSPEQNRALRNVARGSRSGLAKLTEDQVRIIRKTGFIRGQDARFAALFGVSRETVRDARLGKLWRHVYA